MREALAAAVLAALFAGPAGTRVTGEELVGHAARPPRSAGAPILRAISPSGLAVTLPDGNRVRFWPARRVPPSPAPEAGSSPFLREHVSYRIAPGSLVGLVEFSAAWTDSKEQAIPAGAYALVYAVQPAIKEHRGVSELRDALILVTPREFGASAGTDALVEASRRVSGTGHPAVLGLLPPSSPAERESVVRDERGRLVLEVRPGGVPMALILFGANPPKTRGLTPGPAYRIIREETPAVPRCPLSGTEGDPMSSTLEKPLTPMTAPGDATKPLLSLTDAAVAKVKFFAESMPDSQNKPLRVFVQGGGCSGFQYGFTFDEKKENDTVLEQGGITVVVDPQSAIYLKDATVNYVEDFRGAGFSVENPNATGGCGCGKSFNA